MCCVAHRQAPTSRSTGSSMTSATACQGDTAPRDIVQEGRALWRDSRAESHFAWRGMGATLRAVSVAIPRSAGSGHFFPECRHSRRAQTPLPSRARSSPELVKTRRLRCAEFLMGHRCRLVVVGIETGGRWASGLCWFLSTDVFSSVTISQCRTKTKPSVTCHSRTVVFADWFAVPSLCSSTGQRLPSVDFRFGARGPVFFGTCGCFLWCWMMRGMLGVLSFEPEDSQI